MNPIDPRPISDSEAHLVCRVLELAPLQSIPAAMVSGVGSLRVVGVCPCGCATLYFAPIESDQRHVADGVARFPNGDLANLIIWANAERVTTLEVVDHFGAGQLPSIESVSTWEEEGERQAKL